MATFLRLNTTDDQEIFVNINHIFTLSPQYFEGGEYTRLKTITNEIVMVRETAETILDLASGSTLE